MVYALQFFFLLVQAPVCVATSRAKRSVVAQNQKLYWKIHQKNNTIISTYIE